MESASFDLTTYFPLIGGLGLLAIAALHIFRTKELGVPAVVVLLVGGVLCASTAIAKFSVNRDGVSIDMREVVKLSADASRDLILFRSQTQKALANISEQVKELADNQRNLSPPRRPSLPTGPQPLGNAPMAATPQTSLDKLQSLQNANVKLIDSIAEVDPGFRSRLDDVQRILNIETKAQDLK